MENVKRKVSTDKMNEIKRIIHFLLLLKLMFKYISMNSIERVWISNLTLTNLFFFIFIFLLFLESLRNPEKISWCARLSITRMFHVILKTILPLMGHRHTQMNSQTFELHLSTVGKIFKRKPV